MNQIIRNLISLANLTKSGRIIAKNIRRFLQMMLHRRSVGLVNIFSQTGRGVSGQIATLLILIMVIVLVLILITVNIGEVAVKTTAITNVADASVLQLASQLSTRSRQLYESLGNQTKKCYQQGWVAVVLAALFAIAAVVVSILTLGIGTPLALVAIGALAGAIGAATGAAIQGMTIAGSKAFWNTVLMGACIGAAIGAAAGVAIPAAPAMATVEGGGTATVTAAADTASTVSVAAAGGDVTVTITTAAGTTSTMTVAAGTTATIALPAGATATVATSAGVTATVTATGGATITTAAAGGAAGGTAGGGAPAAPAAAPAAVPAAPASTPGLGTQIWGGIQAAVHAVDSAIGWVASLPGQGLDLMGLSSVSNAISSIGGEVLLTGSKGALTVGEALNMAASGYGSYRDLQKMQNDLSKAISSFVNSINSLGDRDAYREGTFLTALSQLVDDPNMTPSDLVVDCGSGPVTGGDPCDSDGDGDTQESVPRFQFWWDRRIFELKQSLGTIFEGIKRFWDQDNNGAMPVFNTFLKNDAMAFLNRGELDCAANPGPIVELFSTLENHGIDVSFWQPGPTLEQWNNWVNSNENCEDESCSPMPDFGYDEVDYTMDTFKEFTRTVDAIQQQDLEAIASSWGFWMDWFYDPAQTAPASEGPYYALFDMILDGVPDTGFQEGLYSWLYVIQSIRNNLPDCTYGAEGIINAPCKTSIDADMEDEFAVAEAEIHYMIDRLEAFKVDIQTLYNDIDQAYANLNVSQEFGGINPVSYTWVDSRGQHSVQIQLPANFKIPSIRSFRQSSGWGDLSYKTCFQLENYNDDGSTTWVRVRRTDPSEKQVGVLGLWKTGVIERTAHAAFDQNPNSVRLVPGN
ncbi:MAG: hypothetical protein PHS93_00025 [Candidatus Omnitrophica bacterium]|nr:hypothetical protein [Candidatus Omnitrophota bacterium]MDD5351548.1 hypothetical protein [Candidatus Omnitrophota bacterium]MDD5550983.1 hypothetical protein [Candidatus Omnitrophota bacterium]